MERKISTKINYDVLKDLDRTTVPTESVGPTVEDVTRSAIAEFAERHSTDEDVVGERVDNVQAAGPSRVDPTVITPRLSSRRDRLPSLQTRKRSLPSFASGVTPTETPPKLAFMFAYMLTLNVFLLCICICMCVFSYDVCIDTDIIAYRLPRQQRTPRHRQQQVYTCLYCTSFLGCSYC